jgi:hypothetical protein
MEVEFHSFLKQALTGCDEVRAPEAFLPNKEPPSAIVAGPPEVLTECS